MSPNYILSETLIPAAAESEQPLYYQLDRHWAAEGHRVSSETVYEWSVEEHFVPTTDHLEITTCSQ